MSTVNIIILRTAWGKSLHDSHFIVIKKGERSGGVWVREGGGGGGGTKAQRQRGTEQDGERGTLESLMEATENSICYYVPYATAFLPIPAWRSTTDLLNSTHNILEELVPSGGLPRWRPVAGALTLLRCFVLLGPVTWIFWWFHCPRGRFLRGVSLPRAGPLLTSAPVTLFDRTRRFTVVVAAIPTMRNE